MMGMGDGGCPSEFISNPRRSRSAIRSANRVTGSLSDFPFVVTLVEVGEDYVLISDDPADPASRIRGTRKSRPLVGEVQALR